MGLVYIASAWSMEAEFYAMAPLGVSAHTTRVSLGDDPEHFTVHDLANLKDKTIEATALLAQAPLNAIAFGCTSGSFANGVAYDNELIGKMEEVSGGIPCTTTSASVVEALNALHINKIAIATPYEKSVYTLARKFMEDSGFTVTNVTGLGLSNDYTISSLDAQTIYKMAREADTEDAEALFISCTGLSAAYIIDALEEDLRKPVIISNQATFWQSLRLSGIYRVIHGFGKLMQT